jgi:hypothetical protein
VAWLKDSRFDLTLIFGVTAVACAMGGAAAISPSLFIPLLAVHTWCFSFHHVVITFSRVAGLPEDRRRHRFLLRAPPLAFALVFAVGQFGGIGVLNTGYFFLQWFHSVRQSWGIAQHYRRAAGGISDDALPELTLWSVPVVGFLHRCWQQPERFFWMEVHLPRVPGAFVVAAGAGAAALVALFFWRRRARLGEPHTLYMATHFLVFALGYLVLDDLMAGWLLVNVWHAAQYLAYVWMRDRERFAGGVRPEARLLSWLAQPRRALLYFGASLAVASSLFAIIYGITRRIDLALDGRLVSLGLVVALGINLHHYLVDAVIWRRRRHSHGSVSAPSTGTVGVPFLTQLDRKH